MSGNWLERKPEQSPGLQRFGLIKDAIAKKLTEEERLTKKREAVIQETERKRFEVIVGVEQKTAEIMPLLVEIRDFANSTGTYPIGLAYSPRDPLEIPNVVIKAEVAVLDAENPNVPKKIERSIDLKYGFGDIQTPRTYGIKIRIDHDSGQTELLRQKIRVVPGQIVLKTNFVPKHEVVIDEWVAFPDDSSSQKKILAEAFHDPVLFKSLPQKHPLRQPDQLDWFDDGESKGIDLYP